MTEDDGAPSEEDDELTEEDEELLEEDDGLTDDEGTLLDEDDELLDDELLDEEIGLGLEEADGLIELLELSLVCATVMIQSPGDEKSRR